MNNKNSRDVDKKKSTLWWEFPAEIEVVDHQVRICGTAVEKLIKQHGSPLYINIAARIRRNYRNLKQGFEKAGLNQVKIYYAIKANPHMEILKLLSAEGAGADVSSPEEGRLALEAGFKKEDILFTGSNASQEDVKFFAERGILINADSFSQLKKCGKYGVKKVSLRWNPGIGSGRISLLKSGGHSAGRQSFREILYDMPTDIPVKFGIMEQDIDRAIQETLNLGIKLTGLHQHIGSDWNDQGYEPFSNAADKICRLVSRIQKKIGYDLEIINFGGGLPTRRFETDFSLNTEQLSRIIKSALDKENLTPDRIIVEPGGYIVGDAGVFLCQITSIEKKGEYNFVGVNAGFNFLNTPSFYDILHDMVISGAVNSPVIQKGFIAGNLCEPRDLFSKEIELPELREGQTVCFLSTGAYAASMRMDYCGRKNAKEIVI